MYKQMKVPIKRFKTNFKKTERNSKGEITLTEMKNSLKRFKFRFEHLEKESANLKIISWKFSRLRNRKKMLKKRKHSLRDV